MIVFCKCGSIKVENRDLGLCASCNAKRRKPEPVQKIYQIPKQSEKKKKRERELAKVRTPKKKAITYCQSCDDPEGPLDYSHTLPVGQFPQYEADEENAVVECRKCHMIWSNGNYEQKTKLLSWPQKLRFILKHEPGYWNKMQLKTKAPNTARTSR